MRALISVSDKRGVVELARGLKSLGVEIISTGGTAKALRNEGVEVVDVSSVTGFPEILDGRVKTLHPKIHGGILGQRSKKEHLAEMEAQGIQAIDLVVVNLYPFEETVAKEGVSLEEVIENIDIGGPSMVRAAAKNYDDVAVVVDPDDYPKIIEEIKGGGITKETRFRLAKKAFAHTARYDGAISNYLSSLDGVCFPSILTLQCERVQDLRYGENPHQKAAFYKPPSLLLQYFVSKGSGDMAKGGADSGLAKAEQLQGREISYNNILDLDSAWALTCTFNEPAAVIIKHTNPCGAATSKVSLKDAFLKARECDPVSAFGGVMGFNRIVDEETALSVGEGFVEAIVAPGYEPAALKAFEKKKNLRLLRIQNAKSKDLTPGWEMRAVRGGVLVQERDSLMEDLRKAKVVTKRAPTDEEYKALDFAWQICKFVRSNAVVFAKEDQLVGVGAGQMSRVDSVRIAIMKARFPLKGTAVASDAFFPFRDNVDECARAGATAIVQPGGSIRDEESINAADEHGMAMIFTGFRHFRH